MTSLLTTGRRRGSDRNFSWRISMGRRGRGDMYAPSEFGIAALLSLGLADILESVGDGFEGAAMLSDDEKVVTSFDG